MAMTANFSRNKRNGETLKKGKSTMPYDKQTAEFIATIGQNIPVLTNEEMQYWIGKPKELQEALRSALVPFQNGNEVVKPKEPEQPLLRKLVSVRVEGAKRFVAKDHLKEANVGWTGGNFDKLFLDLVEENVNDQNVAVHRLERKSKDAPIMAQLGEKARTSLCHFFGLLKDQSKGQEGYLLVNGSANIAYIIGNDGNFWAVLARWDSGRRFWYVNARSVEDPDGWDAGRQVLSRDC